MRIAQTLKASALLPKIRRLWTASAGKILSIERTCRVGMASPVFTVRGRYTARGWTEWTQGFQYGSAILQYDATGDEQFLRIGRCGTLQAMAGHVTHFGVHDHGFNNISTYGNLWRLAEEGRAPVSHSECQLYELALKASGAVQARRWTNTSDGLGFIYSFNGPHSLFVDTIRSCRALAVAHLLGHQLMEEQDRRVSLLHRCFQHIAATSRWSVYYGQGRDAYDIPTSRGRTAHESLFNTNNGAYRCPSTQQGYSPFSTWTRGLAWAMLGFAEQLEFFAAVADAQLRELGGRAPVEAVLLNAAMAVCDFYINHTPADGIPYWDTGAPGLARLGNYLRHRADPFNAHEPVDSSAAAIGAQGLLRLGRYLQQYGRSGKGQRYWQAGLTVARTLFDEPYLSTDTRHQGLILHSVYHRPNGWDYVPPGRQVPCGESSMWGDYHARELALYLQRIIEAGCYYTFFGPHAKGDSTHGGRQ